MFWVANCLALQNWLLEISQYYHRAFFNQIIKPTNALYSAFVGFIIWLLQVLKLLHVIISGYLVYQHYNM
jgi:hypothetical protein